MPSLAFLVAILAAVTLLSVALVFRVNARRKTCKLPPGSMGWPLLGETLSFLKTRPATSLGEFMERHISRYGKTFMSHYLGEAIIISADAELIRFVFKNDTRLFEPGWVRSFVKLMGEHSISSLVGDAHKQMRSIILDLLGSERLRNVYLPDAELIASLLLNSWKNGSVISAKEEATKFSFCIMAKQILSMAPGEPEIEEFMREYHTFTRGLVAFPLSIPGTRYWKALQSRAKILKNFEQIMKERMQKRGHRDTRSEKDDFLSWVMRNTYYSSEQIGTLLLHTLFAGHETTSGAISFMIYFLEGCPKAIEQLREEHIQVVRSKKQNGEMKLTWDDYKAMEFTRCVINETLRLGNIADFLEKRASVEVQFKDYVIPRGCKVITHLAAVHLDPCLYDDPRCFNPWRWLSSSSKNNANNLMPFGGGARLCPGSELARLEMTVFIHHLIMKYNWELMEPDHPVKIPILDFPRGLPIKVQAISLES